MKQHSKITPTQIIYNGKLVNAKIVTITSHFNHNVDVFFCQEMIKKNTLTVTKDSGKLSFLKENDSVYWEQGFVYELDVKLMGLITIWGIHYIDIIKIDKENTTIVTEEKNNICKVWNHTLTFKKISDTETTYTDEVILYAGALTSIYAYSLIPSYKNRHRNWNKLLNSLK